jgi:diguanylate cyclase
MPIGGVISEVQEALRNAGPRIARSRKLEELGQASTDMTGLRNRRKSRCDAARRRHPGLVCDHDKFKLLNDTLGHHAGDAALVHFARIVHDQIRGSDTAARIGGEEFAIWLPGPSGLQAEVADRIGCCWAPDLGLAGSGGR